MRHKTKEGKTTDAMSNSPASHAPTNRKCRLRGNRVSVSRIPTTNVKKVYNALSYEASVLAEETNASTTAAFAAVSHKNATTFFSDYRPYGSSNRLLCHDAS